LNAAQRKYIKAFIDTSGRTHALKPQDLYLLHYSRGKASAKHTALKVSAFILFFSILLGLFTTIYLPKLTHRLPEVITPPVTITLQQPAHEGRITLSKIENTPATIVMAGDSLARGYGSQEINGTLKTMGYYLANHANKVEPGIAQYQMIPDLAIDGSSVEQTNQQIQSHMQTLSLLPNLVLMLSFTNRDMQNFVKDGAKVHSTNRLGEFFQIAQILNRDSKTYQGSLTRLRKTLATLQEKRQRLLGDKKAAMQAVILGLPNEAYSPSVQKLLRQYHLSYSQFSYVINLFNANDREAALLGNRENTGITYSFINLDKLRISHKTALAALSPDQFHPNVRGYELLADFVAQNALVNLTK